MIILDQILTATVYLGSSILIFALGHQGFKVFRPDYNIKEELVEKDNAALALTLCGYYMGLIFAIGGIINGPSAGLDEDLIDILIYGLLAINLLNLSAIVNDKLILSKFQIRKEILEDQNCGTGVVEFAIYLASGLNLYGACFGQGGDVGTAIVFWAVGQAILVVIGKYYNIITDYDIHDQLKKDNVAVGIGFAGALIAMGNLLRVASANDFVSWGYNFSEFFGFLFVAMVFLPVARLITDRVLLPGRSLADELVNQEKPNMGAAFLEAGSYIGSSFLIGWCF